MTEFDLYMNRKNYLKDIGYFYQPTIRDIKELGEEYYYSLIRPFSYTFDILEEAFLNEYPQVKTNFDIFFLRYETGEYYLEDKNSKRSFLELILEALKLLSQQKTYLHDQYQAIVIEYPNNSVLIHRDNFDAVADYVLKINHMSKIEIEPIPKFQNDRQRDVYEKIMAGRKRNAEEKSLSLAEIIKYIRHGGKSIIPFSEINDMHIYQIYEDNTIISKQDNYEKEFGKYLAGSDPKDLHLNPHWLYEVKNKQ